MGIRNIATVPEATLSEMTGGKLLGCNGQGKSRNFPVDEITGKIETSCKNLIDDNGENNVVIKTVTESQFNDYSVGFFYAVDNTKPYIYKCIDKKHLLGEYSVTFERQTGVNQAANSVMKAIQKAIGELIANSNESEEYSVHLQGYDNYEKYDKGYFYRLGTGLWFCSDKTHSGSDYSVELTARGIAWALNYLIDKFGN